MLSKDYSAATAVVRAALWGKDPPPVDLSVYEILQEHEIANLAAGILSRMKMPQELRTVWKNNIYQELTYNVNYRKEMENLPVKAPYVVLKGTSAAQYYPNPHFRTLGDIDIMPAREDYEEVCASFAENGYMETTKDPDSGCIRHRSFRKSNVVIEVHAFFALLSDPRKAQYVDDLILNGITPSHVLPDTVNGLTILEHIGQHLEEGLGLRQVIDWMMFVNKCLPDEKWSEFQSIAVVAGIDKLAIIVTRMCEKYLGLPKHSWCGGADESLCDDLMEYIMKCGDFGRSYKKSDAYASERLLARFRSPRLIFQMLQHYGLKNWEAAKRHRALRPFAWAYQIARYLTKGLARDKTLQQLKSEYNGARRRNEMFEKLEIPKFSEERAVFKDGEYIRQK